jgi:hypothetical protein
MSKPSGSNKGLGRVKTSDSERDPRRLMSASEHYNEPLSLI